jgi:ZIP family zinc transporter
MHEHALLAAFLLTLFAGLSTGFGSLIAFLNRRADPKFLASTLGFSAGVMIYVSFVEILGKARDSMVAVLGREPGTWAAVGAFFGGIVFIALIDRFVPEQENPHEVHRIEDLDLQEQRRKYAGLYKTGAFTALAIAIHNFPEGLATFTATLKDPALGIPIAVAIAIHNIPEGIAVSVPMYYATGSRRRAFLYSFLSGLAEPLGAVIGYTVLYYLFNDVVFGLLFAAVAGIMVFISLDELLPTAEEYGEHHLAVYGLIGGMAVMALSLLLFI